MKNLKIKTKLILIVIISMMSITLFFILNTIYTNNKHLQERIINLKNDAYKSKKEELLNYSEMANKVIDSYYQRTKKDKIQKELKAYIDEQSEYLFNILNKQYNKYHNKMSDKKLKELLYSIVQSSRYGTSGYFWINDFNYKMIMHPIKEQYTGKYFKLNKKVPFVALGVEKLLQKQKDKAYIQYSFYSPSSKKYEEKASIVKIFKPYNWIIGTGAYIDDLTNEMQKDALIAIKHMRYGKNGYFWINNMKNKMLMHPIKSKYDNNYFINTPKVPFVQLGTQALLKNKTDKAFIEYSFYTPSTKKYSHKLSIVQKFLPWNWVVGTGVYTDYLEAKIKKEKDIAHAEMESRIKNILLISSLILLILIFIMIKIMEKIIINPLNNFQNALNNFFKFLSDETVEVHKLNNDSKDEIGLMSKKTNIAIESAVKTHQELINLRKQLEIQVQTTTQDLNKTQKEFEIVNQNTNESLEYGALIQASILPDAKVINDTFTNHFILNIQNNIISSQFYIFETIKTNEYLYIVIDCKKDGINGVFITMLINAIIKQALTQLKYEDKDEISTAWILEYLNKNIEHSKNGFDGAIIYYNKTKNILKYSSANFPLHYYQNDAFHIIHPDIQTIGVHNDAKYTEHIIDIKEYIEIYISTHHYIQNFMDVYNFVSPFKTQTNQFKDNLEDIDDDIIVSGFQIDNKPKIIIEYNGDFTKKTMNSYIETIEDTIDNIGVMSNVSTNFIEQYQNILNYAKSKNIKNTNISPFGYIKLQKNPDETYSIETINTISLADKQKIEPKLYEIQSLDKNGIKKRYRELRKSGINTHSKGGGIGFYEIAKRCLKVEYTFNQINEGRFEFKFISFINASKK